MDTFADFLKNLKNEKTANLIESLESGYNSLFETANVATEEEEKAISSDFLEKLKNVILTRSRDEITPPAKLYPTLDGTTLKAFRAVVNNPNTTETVRAFFQNKINRIENKYRRVSLPIPVDGVN